jgi:hypothetical protein
MTTTTKRNATKASARPVVRLCGCGCGNPVVRKTSNYAPGHDARHASLVAREVVESGNHGLLTALPTTALQAKATAMVERLQAKASKPSKATKATTVKVGRWTYPARKVNGSVERNTKRDGSGEWVAA